MENRKHLMTVLGLLMGIVIGFACAKMWYQDKEHSEVNTQIDGVFSKYSVIPIDWDYAIDLQQDSIVVYTDYDQTIKVKHDGLDEFIAIDNL